MVIGGSQVARIQRADDEGYLTSQESNLSKSRRDFKRGQTVGARPRTELDDLVRQEAEAQHKTSKESLKVISNEKRSKVEDKKATSAPTKDSKDVCGVATQL